MRIPWNKTYYDDEWILENLYAYPSYKALAEEHNKRFGTNIGATAIGGHVKHDLGVNKIRLSGEFLTDEQKAFIEEYYPHHSVVDTTKAFNEKFGTNRAKCTMRNYAQKHGLKVDDEVVTQGKRAPHESGGSKRAVKEIGYARPDRGYWLIKTENGWKLAHRAAWEKHHGKVSKGHAVIYLDGNPDNYGIDNLMEVPMSYLGLLDHYRLRSESATITRAGVKWCELYELLKGEVNGEI